MTGKLIKGSPEAKAFMAKVRSHQPPREKPVWREKYGEAIKMAEEYLKSREGNIWDKSIRIKIIKEFIEYLKERSLDGNIDA